MTSVDPNVDRIMGYWLERSLVKQEVLGSIPAQPKWFFFSPRVKGCWYIIDPDTINCMILRIHLDKN